MLDQPVPNPLAKNPEIHTHKVFASIGIILIVTIAIASGVWWYVESQGGNKTTETDNNVKISTKSSQKATKPSSKVKYEDLITYTSNLCNFSWRYPKNWYYADENNNEVWLINVEHVGGIVTQFRIRATCNNSSIEEYSKVKTYEVGKTIEITQDSIDGPLTDKYYRMSDGLVDGQKSLRYKLDFGYKDADVSDSYNVWVSKENKLHYFRILGGIEISEKVKILDEVLSTLKFL